jgi:hypothetical protein
MTFEKKKIKKITAMLKNITEVFPSLFINKDLQILNS